MIINKELRKKKLKENLRSFLKHRDFDLLTANVEREMGRDFLRKSWKQIVQFVESK